MKKRPAKKKGRLARKKASRGEMRMNFRGEYPQKRQQNLPNHSSNRGSGRGAPGAHLARTKVTPATTNLHPRVHSIIKYAPRCSRRIASKKERPTEVPNPNKYSKNQEEKQKKQGSDVQKRRISLPKHSRRRCTETSHRVWARSDALPGLPSSSVVARTELIPRCAP
jgi:hypothetical protein